MNCKWPVLVLAFFTAIYVQGCISDANTFLPKSFSLKFNADGIGSEFQAENDTIEVTRIHLFSDRFQLITTNEDTLETNLDRILFQFDTSNLGQDENILQGQIGFDDFDTFQSFRVFFTEIVNVPDFFGSPLLEPAENQTYSVAIVGEFNGEKFLLRRKLEFDKSFTFPTVRLTDQEEMLTVRVLTRVEDFVLDAAGRILNPEVDEDADLIIEQFKDSLEVESFSDSELPS